MTNPQAIRYISSTENACTINICSHKVELILDNILRRAQDSCMHLWNWRGDDSFDSVPLYVLAARRGSHFSNVAFRILEYLDIKYEQGVFKSVIQLIKDDVTDDHTVSPLDMNE